MKNAWYIAVLSSELTDELLARTILDQELVLYRDASGVAHALADQCAHRGARLSDGRHAGDCVACPFHGWEYDGSGRCTYIPSNGRAAPIPLAAHVRSYPLREVAGFVWVYLGDIEWMTELQLPPELTDPDWRAVPFRATWSAHFTRVAESVLDVSHLPFVHPTTTGEVDPMVDGPAFTATDDEICVYAKPFHPLLRTPIHEADYKGESTITLTFPNQLTLRTNMLEENQMATYLALTPTVDENGEDETIIYGLALRNFLQDIELLDDVHYEHNITVLDEDRPVVEGLRPKHLPLHPRAEVHVRSDAQQVRYRLMLKKALQSESQEAE
ncbi:aromatic ring-hydroxylating oxygenase subunit alpha [Tumebacillus permanentifrigoris]|uniref:Phenylpropionate dioxygenase-like ring-hydroxylating dioxygenase large terminal subunit n=1 Tax=Tumebacillus permanentifrigoris TaxID=378543 RepID=A0A316DC22_9BACL|nr:aromatic ring-hydroxylating dioxygenase subunit alpha [Tumebacillus permanentifrigoris]PWK15544.1 phenylpropionate dioxygenase-like ring-hydroxylating dioxygenase large terminal subunit [Tumebacillus permanentifrigoris]